MRQEAGEVNGCPRFPEQRCDEYLLGCASTILETMAGPQPIIACLLMKERGIGMVRLVLTARRNNPDARLILDHLS